MVRNYSSIQVSSETKKRLKNLALTKGESYENILIRLLDAKLYGREIRYTIMSIDKQFSVGCVVDWGLTKENIMFVDSDGDLKFEVPKRDFDDDELQLGYDKFRESVLKLNNLVRNLSILEDGESIRAGNLILMR